MRYAATIIVPLLRQRDEWVSQCLGSAVRQTVPCEVLLVASHRTPASNLRAVSRVRSKARNLTVLKQEREGFAAAINTGIHAAACGRVGLLLSDDWLEPNAAEECLKYSEDIVSAGNTTYAADGVTCFPLIKGIPSAREYDRLSTLESKARYLSHFFLFQRSKLLEVGGLDETLGDTPGIDDYDLIWVLLEHGVSVRVVERSLYNYRDHDGERLTLADPAQMTETLRRILRKHRLPEVEIERRLTKSARWFGRPIQEVLRAAGRDPARSGD
jgi:GT2 family glycosyltransferase